MRTSLCAACLLLATARAWAQPEASVRVAEEIAPAGGLAVIQIELTEPVPILIGDITVGKRGSCSEACAGSACSAAPWMSSASGRGWATKPVSAS